jgi:serine/threonine protein kinase
VKPREGSFATVYLARRNTSTSRQEHLALKKIMMKNKDWLEDVKNEINTLKRLKHRNVLELRKAYYYEREPRIVYLATLPWAPATLHDFFFDVQKEENLPAGYEWYTSDKLEPWPGVLQQCAAGLEYLHKSSLFDLKVGDPKPPAMVVKHRDIKPRNILLHQIYDHEHGTYFIRPIIADFGLSSEHVPGGDTENRGTHEFKAPEKFARFWRNQSRTPEDSGSQLYSDIWSLGCCFAFIWILLHSGKPGLSDLWNRTMDADSTHRGFHTNANTDYVHRLLDSNPLSLKDSHTTLFLSQIGTLIKHMLNATTPSSRPSASSVMGLIYNTSMHSNHEEAA